MGQQGASDGERESQALSETVNNILEEARMILPGTQTLFGFQLIVVFNSRFQEQLSSSEQYLHLGAMLLVAVAMAMLIAPAAYHRWVEPEAVSRQFAELATRLLRWSLLPLMLAVCADVFLVSSLIIGRWQISLLIALALLVMFASLWFILPSRAIARNHDHAR